jgi:hypothetical protein
MWQFSEQMLYLNHLNLAQFMKQQELKKCLLMKANRKKKGTKMESSGKMELLKC